MNPPKEVKAEVKTKHINPQWQPKQRHEPSVEEYLNGLRRGDKAILSRAITLIESTRADHQALAQEVMEKSRADRIDSIRIGITGPPGVGKSTFINAFGQYLLDQDRRTAILAVDPSSELSRGSILGDKTRMGPLAADERAFIRPSPAGTTTGGIAAGTRDTIALCEAAGYDTIIVETLGVGQSEMAVHALVDCFMLLLQPGAGDELQGIKRGIVEMADMLVINKNDGAQQELARRTRLAYRNALHLLAPKASGWSVPVLSCSALEGKGLDQVWQLILDFRTFMRDKGYWEDRRQKQASYWLYRYITGELQRKFEQHPKVAGSLPEIEAAVQAGTLSYRKAADELLKLFFKSED